MCEVMQQHLGYTVQRSGQINRGAFDGHELSVNSFSIPRITHVFFFKYSCSSARAFDPGRYDQNSTVATTRQPAPVGIFRLLEREQKVDHQK